MRAVLHPSAPKYWARRGLRQALMAILLLVAAFALGQSTQTDTDVPVLKRRPAPTTNNSGQTSPGKSQSQSTTEPNTPLPDILPPPDSQQNTATPPTAPAPEPQESATPSVGNENAVAKPATPALSYRVVRSRSGGVVRVTIDDASDSEGAGKISILLREVAAQFARGDFSARRFTDGPNTPGIAMMRRLGKKIFYTAHGVEGGAELIISSLDPKGVEAIHQFLQFQAQRHAGSDSIPK